MAKETYYFSHDANARNDEKILMLRADYGWEGYGIYWLLIEMMFETEDTHLYHKNIKGIAVANNINRTKLDKVVNTCIEEGLFQSDGKSFYSESLRRRKNMYKELTRKRSEGGKKAMAKRWGNDKSVISDLQDSNKQDITHDNKGKEKETKSKSKKKEKEDTVGTQAYNDFVDWFKKEFPNTKTKKVRDAKLKDILKEHGIEQIKRATERYVDECKRIDRLMVMEGTFWNGRYLDYLDDNFEYIETPKEKKDKPMSAKTKRDADGTDWIFENMG